MPGRSLERRTAHVSLSFNDPLRSGRAGPTGTVPPVAAADRATAGSAFHELDEEALEEAVQEGIAHCYCDYIRLWERGCADRAFASSLARYAIQRIREGRQVGCRLNGCDPLSRYARRRNGIRLERLDHCTATGEWIATMVEDRRASIPDQVALRIDVSEWFGTLTRGARAIANDLALGFSTSQVARKYRLSSLRISQMRRELCDSWECFQGAGFVAGTPGA